MATIKSFTSLEQSKKLAEILPHESADMYYLRVLGDTYDDNGEIIPISEDNSVPRVITNCEILYQKVDMFSCWSLAALLGVLPEKYTELIKEGGMYRIIIKDSYMTSLFDNPVDACVAIIECLNELKKL